MRVPTLGRENPLEEEMATHSSILAWRIPWTEEIRGLQSVGSQRVRRDWRDLAHMHARIYTYMEKLESRSDSYKSQGRKKKKSQGRVVAVFVGRCCDLWRSPGDFCRVWLHRCLLSINLWNCLVYAPWAHFISQIQTLCFFGDGVKKTTKRKSCQKSPKIKRGASLMI